MSVKPALYMIKLVDSLKWLHLLVPCQIAQKKHNLSRSSSFCKYEVPGNLHFVVKNAHKLVPLIKFPSFGSQILQYMSLEPLCTLEKARIIPQRAFTREFHSARTS